MFKLAKLSVLFVCILVLFFGCSTLKQLNTFSAASVLPEQADIFVRLPVNTNKELCNKVLTNFLPDMSEQNQERLLLSAETVYVALNTGLGDKKQSVQLAVEGNFPFYTSFALSGKNGWSKANKKDGKIKYEYYVHDAGFQLAFPSSSVALLSSDSVLPMLERCETNVLNNVQGISDTKTKREALLSSKSAQIAFYSEEPNLFIKSFIGLDFSFGIQELGGVINSTVLKDGENIYPLDLEFSFEESKAVRAANFALKTAFAFMSKEITVEQIDDLTIMCKSIPISESKVLSLLVGN